MTDTERAVQAYEFIASEGHLPAPITQYPEDRVRRMAFIADDGTFLVLHVAPKGFPNIPDETIAWTEMPQVPVVVREGVTLPDLEYADHLLADKDWYFYDADNGWISTAQGLCRFLVSGDETDRDLHPGEVVDDDEVFLGQDVKLRLDAMELRARQAEQAATMAELRIAVAELRLRVLKLENPESEVDD